MSRLVVPVVLVAAALVALTADAGDQGSATAQDDLEARVAALEAQLADLETRALPPPSTDVATAVAVEPVDPREVVDATTASSLAGQIIPLTCFINPIPVDLDPVAAQAFETQVGQLANVYCFLRVKPGS